MKVTKTLKNVNKTLKNFLTLPNVLFVLATMAVLNIVCKDNNSEGLKGMLQRAEERKMTNEMVGDSQGTGADLPLGVVIAIIVVIIIIGTIFMKK